MNAYVHKPENALRRARELTQIKQPTAALTLLHDVLSSRRHRTWSPSYEKIMIAYIDLCLDLNKTREAKDGLHQYRNLSQSQAPGSLEVVIRYLLDKAEEQCLEAKTAAEKAEANGESSSQSSDALAAMPPTDPDAEPDPSSPPSDGSAAVVAAASSILALSAVAADPARGQRESALLVPRVRFLWESYRAVLDILKSNSKLERLYHHAASSALRFCGAYKRRTEFRRCCDLLRVHLQNLQKYGGIAAMAKVEEGGKPNNKVRGWEGWTTESVELHLQTRFVQLETSSQLHLYTEGFRTVEDIYSILQTSVSRRRPAAQVGGATAPVPALNGPPPLPKARLMAAYYEKLTTLFWVSENYLFHAFAWYKFYTLCHEYNRGMTPEQRRLQASAVLLSTLCIPTLTADLDGLDGGQNGGGNPRDAAAVAATRRDEIAKEKTARMATLLGFHTRDPTRNALLSEIRTKDVLAQVPSYLRELHSLLEEDTNPLSLVERAKPLLEKLRGEVLQSAVDGSPISVIDDATDEKKEEQPATVATTAGTLGAYVEPLVSVLLLKLIHSLSRSYHTISLGHIKTLTSGLGIDFSRVEKAIVSAGVTSGVAVKVDHMSNCLRFGAAASEAAAGLESAAMVSHLSSLSHRLSDVCNTLSPPDVEKKQRVGAELFALVRAEVPGEHDAMLARKEMIERRKEEVERVAQEKMKEEDRKRKVALENAKVEEGRRLAREQQLREKEKLEKIKKELETMEKKRYLQAMGQNVETMTAEELEKMDPDALAREHAAKAQKKKNDAERKVREMQKKLDYVVRATRIEEIPLVKKMYADKVKEERERYEANVVEKAKKLRLQWENDRADKIELNSRSVFAFMSSFEEAAMTGRRVEHNKLCDEADLKAEEEAEDNKMQRARKRKEEAIRLRKEEEDRLIREEEEKREEEDRQKREEERKLKEEEEQVRRKKEVERMATADRERNEREQGENTAPPASKDLERAAASTAPTKYEPPSSRFGGNNDDPKNPWGADKNRGGGYGGGRYEGSRDGGAFSRSDRGGNERNEGDSRGEQPPADRFGFGNREKFGRDSYNNVRGNDRSGGDRDGYNKRYDDRGPPEPRNNRWG